MLTYLRIPLRVHLYKPQIQNELNLHIPGRHKRGDGWFHEDIAPQILQLGITWKWMFSFTLRPFHPRANYHIQVSGRMSTKWYNDVNGSYWPMPLPGNVSQYFEIYNGLKTTPNPKTQNAQITSNFMTNHQCNLINN